MPSGTFRGLYVTYPVVEHKPGELVYLVGVYLDGASFARHDSALGLWMDSLLTQKRHLVPVLRKSSLCQCGCRGWCSLVPICSWLHWSCLSLALGRWPAARHDRSPFRPSEPTRIQNAGAPMGLRMAVVFVKGDWMEFVSSHRGEGGPCTPLPNVPHHSGRHA